MIEKIMILMEDKTGALLKRKQQSRICKVLI